MLNGWRWMHIIWAMGSVLPQSDSCGFPRKSRRWSTSCERRLFTRYPRCTQPFLTPSRIEIGDGGLDYGSAGFSGNQMRAITTRIAGRGRTFARIVFPSVQQQPSGCSVDVASPLGFANSHASVNCSAANYFSWSTT